MWLIFINPSDLEQGSDGLQSLHTQWFLLILLSWLLNIGKCCQSEDCCFKTSALISGPQFEVIPHIAGHMELEIPAREAGYTKRFLLHKESLFHLPISHSPFCSLPLFSSSLLIFLCSYIHLGATNMERRTVGPSGAAGMVLDEVTHGIAKWGWGSAWTMPTLLFYCPLVLMHRGSLCCQAMDFLKEKTGKSREGRMAPRVNLCTVRTATTCIEVAETRQGGSCRKAQGGC